MDHARGFHDESDDLGDLPELETVSASSDGMWFFLICIYMRIVDHFRPQKKTDSSVATTNKTGAVAM